MGISPYDLIRKSKAQLTQLALDQPDDAWKVERELRRRARARNHYWGKDGKPRVRQKGSPHDPPLD